MPVRSWVPLVACAAALLTAGSAADGAVQTRDVKYAVGGAEYVGFLAYDDATPGKRPGVLVAPEWTGVNDYARGRAKQLAGMGYAAFVIDPYGGGRNAADVKQSAEWSTALKDDRPELRRRVAAGFDTLKKQPQVDPAKTAAIGYCFGGTTVLELARSGADVLGVVSFHGGLSTTAPAKAGELKSKVLVCHGAVDPFVPPAEVAGFEKEMQAAKADWQLVAYGDSLHSFTNPDAGKAAIPGVAYNEKADRRSWEAMKGFFGELFGGAGEGQRAAYRPAGVRRAGTAVATTPKAAVFGTVGNSKRIVFVCDASANMINGLGIVKQELTRAIGALGSEHSLNIIFFSNGSRYRTADTGRLMPATPENKRHLYSLMDGVAPEQDVHEVADPGPALDAAFRQNPDLVYLLAESRSCGLKSYVRTSAALERLNVGRKVKVSTILYNAISVADAVADETMGQIAADNGGSSRSVREEDLEALR